MMIMVRLLAVFLVLILVDLPVDRCAWAEDGPNNDVYGGEYDEQNEPYEEEGDFGDGDRLDEYDRGEEGGEGEIREEEPYGSENQAEIGDGTGRDAGGSPEYEDLEEMDDPTHGSAEEMKDRFKLPWQDDKEIDLDIPTDEEPGMAAEKSRSKMLKAKFEEGETHFKAGLYYKALEAYKTVKKWAADIENETKRLDIIQKMNWNIAFCYEKLELYDQAIEYYKLVLDSDPEPKLEKACYRRIEGILKKS